MNNAWCWAESFIKKFKQLRGRGAGLTAHLDLNTWYSCLTSMGCAESYTKSSEAEDKVETTEVPKQDKIEE